MWSDPIADMLTRIRNAVRVRSREVKVPLSNVKASIAEVLKQEGYILGYDRIEDVIRGLGQPSPDQVIHRLEEAWIAHRQGLPAVEDFTILCLSRRRSEEPA